MNYAVTGGAGFIGSHLIDSLLARGHRVACIDNLASGKEENIAHHRENARFVFYRQDVCDDLSHIFEQGGFDSVFHLAASINVQYSIQHPRETHHINVNGLMNVLDSCVAYHVRRLIFSSSAAVYGNQETHELREDMQPNALSPYALHKIIGEHYCQLYHDLYKLETISLRNFNVYGPRQDMFSGYANVIPLWIGRILRGLPPVINGDGDQTRDYIYITDVVDAFVAAVETRNVECFGGVFNIGTGVGTSVNHLCNHIRDVAKTSLAPERGPSVVEPRHSRANVKKAKKHFNWEPCVPLQNGIQKIHEHLVELIHT